jgi:hypothetical protein
VERSLSRSEQSDSHKALETNVGVLALHSGCAAPTLEKATRFF